MIQRLFILAIAMAAIGACTPMTKQQQQEYQAMQDTGILVEEKNPGTGAALGILPGGGAFYARRPGIGVVDLLFWPLSVVWDPVVGYHDSKKINYDVTMAKLERQQKKELNRLEDQRDLGRIDDQDYVIQRRRINQKYEYPFVIDAD